MPKPGHTGLKRIILASKYSAQGFIYAWRHESAFRQEIVIACILIPLAIWLGESPLDMLLLIAPIFFVLIVELLNSSVEATLDSISNKEDKIIGGAKDMASAAVFLSLLILISCWTAILYKNIFYL